MKAKIVFKNPKKYELVFFDGEPIKEFENLLYHYNFFILQTRMEKIKTIYFSTKILKYFIKNYNGNIMTAYLVSLIEVMSPKVVLTFIDNSLKFFDVAKILEKKIHFLAIQNAARLDLKQYKYLYEKKILNSDHNKKFYIPNFFCFGQFEIDHYKEFGIKVKNFFKVGSLRLANALLYIKNNKIKMNKFNNDICLIGEGVSGGNFRYDALFDEEKIFGFEKGMVDMVRFTVKFCLKHNMKLVSPQKVNKTVNPKEYYRVMNTYKKYMTDKEFNFFINSCIERTVGRYDSYIAMFQSKVTIGTSSTLLRENLAVGGKVLSCNLLKTDIHDFPLRGACSIKNCTFEEFEKRLLQVYSMSEEVYFSKLEKNKSYVLEYDQKVSTIEILKKKIDSFLFNEQLSDKLKIENQNI